MQTSRDTFLGGRLKLFQPMEGHHRSGIDAVLLAAACNPPAGGTVVDLGAGVGVAGLCVGVRHPHVRLILVDRDPQALALARQNNVAHTTDPNRAATVLDFDITAPAERRLGSGLAQRIADCVLINPPFHHPDRVRKSPNPNRAAAHVLGPDGLDPWIRCAHWLLRSKGLLHMILPAHMLRDCLEGLAGRYGGVSVFPLFPRPGKPAKRIVVIARKDSRAKLELLPGLILHGPSGNQFTPSAEAVLQHAAPLDMRQLADQEKSSDAGEIGDMSGRLADPVEQQ